MCTQFKSYTLGALDEITSMMTDCHDFPAVSGEYPPLCNCFVSSSCSKNYKGCFAEASFSSKYHILPPECIFTLFKKTSVFYLLYWVFCSPEIMSGDLCVGLNLLFSRLTDHSKNMKYPMLIFSSTMMCLLTFHQTEWKSIGLD